MLSKIINICKKHRFKIIIALVIIGIGYAIYQRSQTPEPEQVFEKPQYRDIVKNLELSGSIDAKRKARLRFIAGGKITYLGAEKGDWVEKWQTLASIDQRDLEKRLERTLNLYMQQRWDFEGAKEDFEDSLQTLDERRAQDKRQWDLENSVIDVQLQDIAISNTIMSAPFSGVLVQKPVSVAHTQVLASDYWELIDPESLIFRTEVDEEDVVLLKLNQAGTIILDAYPDEELSSEIDYISYKSTEGALGTVFEVEISIPTSAEGLNKYRLGMNGEVLIELDRKEDALTIPFISTKSRDRRVFVDIKTADDQIEEREVKLGLETDEYVEVLEGLSENDLVLIPQTE